MLNKNLKKVINKLIYFCSSRFHLKILSELRFPRKISRFLLKKIRIIVNLGEFKERKKIAKKLAKSNSTYFEIKDSLGFCTFDVNKLKYGTCLLNESKRIIERNKNKDNNFYKGGKKFFNDLLTLEDLKNYPVFFDFASDLKLINSISRYLGIFPIIGNIRIIESIENDTMISSQLFHLDPEDYKQVKIFINLSDITFENGPLTLLSSSETKKIIKKVKNPYLRVSDDEIYKLSNKNNFFECIAPFGQAFAVDTCSCFHMGSRTRMGNRIVLVISYLSFPGIVEPGRTSNIDFKRLGIKIKGKNSNMLLRSLRPKYLA
tara:strand:- start:20020 stop:20973 length:954 start_codon:yes stop_codon:yes gene_type:complete